MLDDRTVAVFAATGQIGGITARTLAAHGAHVVVSGRDGDRAAALADAIIADGGQATAAIVDATDPKAVDVHLADVAAAHGLHGCVNAIGLTPAALGYPARSGELDPEVFLRPFRTIVTSQFLTSRSAAEVMGAAAGGAVVTLSASLTGGPFPFMASLTGACGAIEAMTRSLSGEYGPAGVRINCVRADAMPETTTIQQTGAGQARLAGLDPDASMPDPGPLGRPLTVAQTAEVIAFLLSDAASGTASQTFTVSDRPMVGG